jgi:tRNA (guanine37-N1)-methyltransferase
MRVFLLSLFPRALDSYFATSMMQIAQDRKILELTIINIADYSIRNTRRVDDRPYGGGAGTLIAAEPCARAMEYAQSLSPEPIKWIVTDPRGAPLCQPQLELFSRESSIGILCWHYEGVDERVLEHFLISKVSLGPYIITGGELAAGVLVDGITRLLPWLLDPGSLKQESFSAGLEGKWEYPQYTRPEIWRERSVPAVLLSGNHAKIKQWQLQNIQTD